MGVLILAAILVVIVAGLAIIVWLGFKGVFSVTGAVSNAISGVGRDQLKNEAREALAQPLADVDVADLERIRSALRRMRNDWEARDLCYALEQLQERANKKVCPNCNAEVDKAAEYCPSCGEKLVPYTREETQAYIQELRNTSQQRKDREAS